MECKGLFQSGVGTLKQFKSSLSFKEEASPRFCCLSTASFAIKIWIGEELDRLKKLVTLHKVDRAKGTARTPKKEPDSTGVQTVNTVTTMIKAGIP